MRDGVGGESLMVQRPPPLPCCSTLSLICVSRSAVSTRTGASDGARRRLLLRCCRRLSLVVARVRGEHRNGGQHEQRSGDHSRQHIVSSGRAWLPSMVVVPGLQTEAASVAPSRGRTLPLEFPVADGLSSQTASAPNGSARNQTSHAVMDGLDRCDEAPHSLRRSVLKTRRRSRVLAACCSTATTKPMSKGFRIH